MVIDNSFIRLKESLAEALDVGDPSVSTHDYHNIIQVVPSQKYLQITNTENGIAFNQDYTVKVVNCKGIVIADITPSVYIKEFIDENGLQQIAFELAYLNVDFYNESIILQFAKNNSNDVWFSNPILITEYRSWETVRFDYSSVGRFEEISYERAGALYQSISLRCFYDKPVPEVESGSYKQISRPREVKTGSRIYRKRNFIFEYVNPFVLEAATVLLQHDLLYINGDRCTHTPGLKDGKREGDSNLIPTEFLASIDRTDNYIAVFQIASAFDLTQKTPEGVYTINTFPNQIQGKFNKQIVLGTGTITVYRNDGSTLQTFTETDIVVNGNIFSIPFATPVDGSYYIQISNGLFSSGTEVYAGISNTTDWVFEIMAGEYDETEYDETEYF